MCKFVSEMWIIVQKSEGLEMYMLELYQNPSYKDLVAFGSLKEGKEFVSKITGLSSFSIVYPVICIQNNWIYYRK